MEGNPKTNCNSKLEKAAQSVAQCEVSAYSLHNYFRQVNEMNGGDINVFVRCSSVCVCGTVKQTIQNGR